jgi:hypothetical protein
VNEELGLPELKKLLAAAQRQISILKNQISSPTPVCAELDDNLELPQSESDGEEDPTPNEQLAIRIAELEELLENQRFRFPFSTLSIQLIHCSTLTEENRSKILEGELIALKQTVAEFEAKLLAV